jgi:PAS domain S-box-containing protein
MNNLSDLHQMQICENNPQDHRIIQIIDSLNAIAALNFNKKIAVNDPCDHLDVIGFGINMLSEALQETVITKEQYKANEEQFRALVEASLEGIIFHKNGTITNCNSTLLKILGKPKEAVVGNTVCSLFSGQHIENIRNFIVNPKEEKIEAIPDSVENNFVCELIRRPLHIDGEILEALVIRDISERKKYEQELLNYNNSLRKINDELNQFAYIVSHDLKAPLRAIASLASFIEEDLEGQLTPEVGEHLHLLKGRVQRMQNLIDGILEFSRVGRTVQTIEFVQVSQIIEDIIHDATARADDKSVHIIYSHSMPALYCSKVRIIQVFQNLISNAIKHNNKAQCEIKINCIEQAEFWEFSVTDNGPGIDPQFHEKVFNIFQTLSARDNKENTGVGLSIVKKIIEEEGKGTIWLLSEPGNGASFHFTWSKKAVLPFVVADFYKSARASA